MSYFDSPPLPTKNEERLIMENSELEYNLKKCNVENSELRKKRDIELEFLRNLLKKCEDKLKKISFDKTLEVSRLTKRIHELKLQINYYLKKLIGSSEEEPEEIIEEKKEAEPEKVKRFDGKEGLIIKYRDPIIPKHAPSTIKVTNTKGNIKLIENRGKEDFGKTKYQIISIDGDWDKFVQSTRIAMNSKHDRNITFSVIFDTLHKLGEYWRFVIGTYIDFESVVLFDSGKNGDKCQINFGDDYSLVIWSSGKKLFGVPDESIIIWVNNVMLEVEFGKFYRGKSRPMDLYEAKKISKREVALPKLRSTIFDTLERNLESNLFSIRPSSSI